jgi:murein DD-endopeptidase MepM/ murein hydrolase activator NlpD
VGQQVSRGQVVGSVGDTGWSTACHLHFTVLADGRPVNPMNYL